MYKQNNLTLLESKYENLQNYIKSFEKAAVAFSSGVDSTLLLKVCVDALGTQNVIAVTAASDLFPKRELTQAKDFCKENNIKHIIFNFNELNIDGFRENPKNRCYICKRELFCKITDIANDNGISNIFEGSNTDDDNDYRPGIAAIKELGVKSPLRYAKLSKEDIRTISKRLGLPTWNKQSFACLASRFAYDEIISEKKLNMVDKAEQLLLDMGFHQIRVRIHGNDKNYIARIEIQSDEFEKIMPQKARENIYNQFKDIGFAYVTLDLIGYRTGSMNEVLDLEK